MTPDRSFKAYAAQSTTIQTIKSNWALRRINLGMAIASLLFVGISAACTGTTEPAVPPIATPDITAEEVVHAMNPEVIDSMCNSFNEAVDGGLDRDDLYRAGYEVFKHGYGEPNEGMPSAWNVYQHLMARCES